jgi:hypothetical protein
MDRSKITLNDPWLALMCMFRYSLGRRTYMVSHTVTEIFNNWEILDLHSKQKLVDEILEHERLFDSLGDECDKNEWYKIIDRFNDEKAETV